MSFKKQINDLRMCGRLSFLKMYAAILSVPYALPESCHWLSRSRICFLSPLNVGELVTDLTNRGQWNRCCGMMRLDHKKHTASSWLSLLGCSPLKPRLYAVRKSKIHGEAMLRLWQTAPANVSANKQHDPV